MRKLKSIRNFAVITGVLVLLLQHTYAQTNAPTTATKVATTSVTAYKPAAYSQDTFINYVRTWQPKRPYSQDSDVISGNRTVDEVNRTTQYIDGLGRPIQTVNWQTSPDKKDMVAPQVYDSLGREQYNFLPYTDTASDGQFKQDPFGNQSDFYTTAYPAQQPAFNNEKIYYSKTVFEESPLNRVLKSFAPGNSWAGSEGSAAEHAVQMQYMFNTVNDSVRLWNITNDTLVCHSNDTSINIPTSTSVYDPGQLFKDVSIDERGNEVIEYKDKEGHVILKKVQIGDTTNSPAYTNWLCTYYVYDDYGQLRFVMPPKVVEQLCQSSINWQLSGTVINELCFRYEYDSRNRIIAKKVPGAGWCIWYMTNGTGSHLHKMPICATATIGYTVCTMT